MPTYTTRFLIQDHFKTISVGASPYLPSVRKHEMRLQNEVGKSGKGFQLTPVDKGGDAAYHALSQNYFSKVRGWNATQDSILPETKELSIDLAKRLFAMLDYKGKDFSNPPASAIEGEIQNFEIMKQMPEDIKQKFMSSKILQDLGNIGVSNALDHQRTTAEGMMAIELIGELAGGKMGQSIKDSAYALDVTDSKASKYLTGEFSSIVKIDGEKLKEIEQVILDKIQDMNDQFEGIGYALDKTTKVVKDVFKGSVYEGKTTTNLGTTSLEAFGKHVLANFIGIGNLMAKNPNSTMTHNMFVFQEPIGHSGYTAIITLRPDARTTKKAIRLIPQVKFKKVAPDGEVATSGLCLAAAYNQYATRNNLDNIQFKFLDDVGLANLAVQTASRIAAIGGIQEVAIGEMVDDSTVVLAEVIQTMTTSQIGKSLHAQIDNWAKNPDNRKKFERWYNHAFEKTNKLYHSWRAMESAFYNASFKGEPGGWMYRPNQDINPRTDIRPNVLGKGTQSLIASEGDHGIWNEKPNQWMTQKDALGLSVSPYLISRNKFVSKWGNEFK